MQTHSPHPKFFKILARFPMAAIALPNDLAAPHSTVPSPATAQAVVDCYDVLDICLSGGVHDFTDGKYIDGRNNRRAYLAAQQRQAEYLLDQVGCYPGEQLLEIGCGYGRILQQAQQRGVGAVGLTLSPLQAAACRQQGLAALVLNYRDIPRSGQRSIGRVQGIVANGSLEHFVQLDDAVAQRNDLVYSELFRICRSLLSPGQRFVTTAIHFSEADRVDPQAIRRGHAIFEPGCFEYHYANLVEAFGGWYPEPAQLERCAEGTFALVTEEDGTHDYYLTSEYWLRQLKWSLATSPGVWWALAKKWRAAPRAMSDMMRCLLTDQSWNWQFRGPSAPMRLLRQTWQAV
jgi:cyclopropane fatty-acyl-phospholipid synthase-like methyltransferase